MNRKRIYSILTGMILTLHLFSQESWDIKKCINHAINNNLNYKVFLLEEETAKVNAIASRMSLMPSMSASGRLENNYGRSVDKSTYEITNTENFTFETGLNANLVLFDGFKRINSIQYTNYRKQASYWNTLKSRDDLAFSVMMAYYDIVYYKGLIKIAGEQLELSSFNLKKTNAEVLVGIKSKTDLAEMQAIFEQEKLALVQSINNLNEAELQLKKYMNASFTDSLKLAYDSDMFFLEVTANNGFDSTVQQYLETAPELLSAEAALSAAKMNLAIQQGKFSPSLQLYAGVGTGVYESQRDTSSTMIPVRNQLNNNMSQNIGLYISIPIFQRYSNIASVKRAKINVESARITYDNQKLDLYYQLKNDINKWNALEAEFRQLSKQVEANELAYKAANRRYQEGITGIIEMLTVKNRLAISQSQLLQTRLQWEIQYKLMEFYKGTRFWEN